jgi:phospholipid/cholesterol/gamma-HCH transport system substrate-binding protein
VALLFWLTDRGVGGAGVPVEVTFANAAGIEVGDGVWVSGVKKGRVDAVELERPGRVKVRLEVDADVAPRLDASATVAALDFLGNKIIDYSPGEREDALPAGTIIVGKQNKDLADVAGTLATRADELLGNATALLSDQLATEVHGTLRATRRAMDALAQAKVEPLVAQTTATLAATERTLSRIDSMLASSTGKRVDTLTANLARLTSHLSTATASLDSLLTSMSRGDGTLGRIAKDTLLYHNLNETLAALTALMKDLRERPGRYLTVKVF